MMKKINAKEKERKRERKEIILDFTINKKSFHITYIKIKCN